MATMMGLGPFRFGLETAAYQALERSTAYRWVAQERIGRRPALQFLGIGEETIRLEGVVFPTWRGGIEQVETMRNIAGGGVPFVLVSGFGRYFGRYVIVNVEERQAIFFRDGVFRKQEFFLELSHYGDDAGF